MSQSLSLQTRLAGSRLRASLSPSARFWVKFKAQEIAVTSKYGTHEDWMLRAAIRARFESQLRTLSREASERALEAILFVVLFEVLEGGLAQRGLAALGSEADSRAENSDDGQLQMQAVMDRKTTASSGLSKALKGLKDTILPVLGNVK